MRELEKLEGLGWLFEYPEDNNCVLDLPDKDDRFRLVLENILKALDPSIKAVDISQEVEKTYIVRIPDNPVILQDGKKLIVINYQVAPKQA